MKTKVFLSLVGLAIVAAGCTMAPKYNRPPAPVPADWPGGPAYEQALLPTNAPSAPDLNWREFFTDPKLQQVIGLALTNNRDLRLAAQNVELARAMYGIRRAELYPSISADGRWSKQRVPPNVQGFPGAMSIERYDVNLGLAAWEIDFFGRIRSLKDRALQEYLASEQAWRSAQILLISSVANAYLILAADHENLELAENTLNAQTEAYRLVKRQFEAGIATELDLRQAQIPVEAARREVARYTQLVAQDENALNLLAGKTVPVELLPTKLAAVSLTKEVSPRLPSEVLLRRPDVLQAEAMLKAAYADIGAARAAFFPSISLTAALGTASADLSGLFKSGTGAWNYAPKIVMPIFDARTWAGLKVTQIQQRMAITQYEKAIQVAFREVADALAALGTMNEQVGAQQSLVNALSETHRLAVSRYEKGLDSYLSVLDAQRSLFAAQQGLASLQLAQTASRVRLYAVLGGGGESEK